MADEERSKRWETNKEWAGWTLRDELFAYVRKHWGRSAMTIAITTGGAVYWFMRQHTMLLVACGVALATYATTILIPAFIQFRKRKASVNELAVKVDAPEPLKPNPVTPIPAPIDYPMAIVRREYENHQVSLLVQNIGGSAEFYGIFEIRGMVNVDKKTDLYCSWANTDSQKTRIAKGLTCRIDLAELKWDRGIATWQINHTTKNGFAHIAATYSSTTDPNGRAPSIVLRVSIVAEPDLMGGIQQFEVVLEPFGPKIV